MGHVKTVLQPGQVPSTVNKGDKGVQGIPGPVTPGEPKNILVWSLLHNFNDNLPWPSSIVATLKIVKGDMWTPLNDHVFAPHATNATNVLSKFILPAVVNPRITAYVTMRKLKVTPGLSPSGVPVLLAWSDNFPLPVKSHITRIEEIDGGEVYWSLNDPVGNTIFTWQNFAQNYLPPSELEIDILIIGDRDSV